MYQLFSLRRLEAHKDANLQLTVAKMIVGDNHPVLTDLTEIDVRRLVADVLLHEGALGHQYVDADAATALITAHAKQLCKIIPYRI